MQLRPSLFWDFDIVQIDLLKHKASVIERITLRGRLEEFMEMIRFYGKETAKTTLLNARYLDNRTLSYCVFFLKHLLLNSDATNSHSRTPNIGIIKRIDVFANA